MSNGNALTMYQTYGHPRSPDLTLASPFFRGTGSSSAVHQNATGAKFIIQRGHVTGQCEPQLVVALSLPLFTWNATASFVYTGRYYRQIVKKKKKIPQRTAAPFALKPHEGRILRTIPFGTENNEGT